MRLSPSAGDGVGLFLVPPLIRMGEAWSKAGLKVSAKDRLCGRAKMEVPALSLLLHNSGLVISSLSETQFLYLVQ